MLNLILGISENGESVYFVANGVLAPGAKPGDCTHIAQETPAAGATCNLYVWHERHDQLHRRACPTKTPGIGAASKARAKKARTSSRAPTSPTSPPASPPNGEYLAFMSQQPLTGYDNTDANEPGVRDQEVYLYQASTRQLTCVSCNPNGPSSGVLDTPFSGEGLGLVVDRRGDWLGQYLAGSIPGWTPLGLDTATHQPRYLSNSGRLFFNSPDQLVPQATNAKEDVYEYEPNRRRQLQRTAGLHLADLLRQRAPGIRVRGSQRKRRQRVLRHRPTPRRRRPRHQLRPL